MTAAEPAAASNLPAAKRAEPRRVWQWHTWFSRRALVWHALLLIIVPGCLFAGWWQIHRALSGNWLSWAYSVEWPVFAIIAVVGWWQLVTEDPVEVEERKEERERRALPRDPYPAFPLMLTERSSVVDSEDRDTSRATLPVKANALDEYNRYLASLAQARVRKSWRNPRGLPPEARRVPDSPE